MDKKKLLKSNSPEDLKGFEEFIEGQPQETHFLPRGVGGGTKRETNFEHFTFLTNDSNRLLKMRNLLADKIPFTGSHPQGDKLIGPLKQDVDNLKKKIHAEAIKPHSGFQRSMREIFDGFFGTQKP